VKIKRTFLAVATLIAVPALGQEVEHAPTVAQCQADQALWTSRLVEPTKGWEDTVKDTPMKTVVTWGKEMSACSVVDPQNATKYNRTAEYTLLVLGARQADFLRRHDLMGQFWIEDAAGQR
jgi:hypothetical protein